MTMADLQTIGDLARLLGAGGDESAGWQQSAVCAQVDPELFFPDKGRSARPAQQICLGCPVRAECLDWALAHHEQGVWGGLTERERRELTRPRATSQHVAGAADDRTTRRAA